MTLCRHILSDDNNKAVTMRRNISYDCSLTKLLLVVRWTLGSRERTQAYRRCTFDFFNAYFSVLKMHISLFLRLHISLFPKLLCVPLLLHWLGFTWSAWEASSSSSSSTWFSWPSWQESRAHAWFILVDFQDKGNVSAKRNPRLQPLGNFPQCEGWRRNPCFTTPKHPQISLPCNFYRSFFPS